MERYWVANGILASNECGGLVKYDDAQRALDAEREKAKQLDRTLADVYQQRDGLQAQLAQPIHICQRCGRVSRDGWVTARYECDELRGSLQCPDCQCIDLEINTAKELATLCTQAQAQLRQVEGERDALKLVNETHMKTVMKLSSIIEKSSTLAHDAGKEVGNGDC